MALSKVPGGSRNYYADNTGLAEIALSPKMADAMLDVGKTMATRAEAVGDSKYGAENTIIHIGRDNEARQGVSVHETESHWRDWRDAILLRVMDGMEIRGGGR